MPSRSLKTKKKAIFRVSRSSLICGAQKPKITVFRFAALFSWECPTSYTLYQPWVDLPFCILQSSSNGPLCDKSMQCSALLTMSLTIFTISPVPWSCLVSFVAFWRSSVRSCQLRINERNPSDALGACALKGCIASSIYCNYSL